MVEADMEHLRSKGQGIVPKGSKIEIRWNSKVWTDRRLLRILLALVERGQSVRAPNRDTFFCFQAVTLAET